MLATAHQGCTRSASHEGDILADLRRETWAIHESLEQLLGYPDSLQSIPGYLMLLDAFYAITSPLEQILMTRTAELPASLHINDRIKAPLIRQDLATLGAEPHPVPVPELEALDSSAKLMGALYVLEGSTLGGQVIRRYMLQQHGTTAQEWLTFFGGYGKKTAAKWASFRDCLDAFSRATPDSSAEIIAGAHTVYAAFKRLLGPVNPSGNSIR